MKIILFCLMFCFVTSCVTVGATNQEGESVTVQIKNQYQASKPGTCWAHALITAVELQYKINTGETIYADEEELIQCADNPKGSIHKAIDYMKDWGVHQAFFPEVHQCRSVVAGKHFITDVEWYNGLKYSKHYKEDRFSSYVLFDQIKEALTRGKVIVATMNPTRDWMNWETADVYEYKEGMMQSTSAHAVVIVGINEYERYFVVQNSYGASFGYGGYINMDFDEINTYTKLCRGACFSVEVSK